MTKAEAFQTVLELFRKQSHRLASSARDAKDSSTGDEVKSESKYDTRGLEASYLAEAQAEQAEEAKRALIELEGFLPKDFTEEDTVAIGALVETERDGDISYYFLLPHGGGITIDYLGFDLNTLTPDSPMYQSLLGTSYGDTIDSLNLMILGIE